MYQFNQAASRLHTGSTKWDRYESRYQLQDVIPLWVADMDFECLPEVSKAIIHRAKHKIYGYTDVQESLYQAVIDWEKRHHHIDVKKEEIVWNTGVVYGIYTLIDWLVARNEKVMVQTPVYPPFFNIPKSLERDVVYNPLKKEDGIWKMDLVDFEEKIKQDSTIKMFILCNPHNPVGRCYTKEELETMLELCEQYDLYVISDEIHADIIMPGKKHTSILACHEKYHNRIFLLGSATKTFNLAGLKISYAIVKNERLKEEFASIAKANGLSSINIFAMEAMQAAYQYGDQWLEECCIYIYENFHFMKEYLNQYAPEISFDLPEATYLAWVDFSKINCPNLANRLKYEAHVEIQEGSDFQAGSEGFQRINLACPRNTLKEGLDRIIHWLQENHLLVSKK